MSRTYTNITAPDSYFLVNTEEKLHITTFAPEILCLIFGHTGDLKTQLIIPQVCRSWRAASLGNTPFWADVNINNILYDVIRPLLATGTDQNSWPALQTRNSRIEKGTKALMALILQRASAKTSFFITGDFLGPYIPREDIFTIERVALPFTTSLFFNEAALAILKSPISSIKSAFLVIHPCLLQGERCFRHPSLRAQYALVQTVPRKRVGSIWIHNTVDNHPNPSDQSLKPGDNDLRVVRKLKGWKEEDKAYKALQKRFIAFRTTFSLATGRLRSNISVAQWTEVTVLFLTLPGSSYRYLPILAETKKLKNLRLTFTSPPIFDTDDPSTPQPTAYPGNQKIHLPSLALFEVRFLNGSFVYPSSWKFFDAFAADEHSQLDHVTFYSDHFQLWPPPVGSAAYIPFFYFLRRLCRLTLGKFESSVGPGMDVQSLISSLSSWSHVREDCDRHIDELILTYENWDPRHISTAKDSLWQALDIISKRYSTVGGIFLSYPLPKDSESGGHDLGRLGCFMEELCSRDGFGSSPWQKCKVLCDISLYIINSDVQMIRKNQAYPINVESPLSWKANLDQHLEPTERLSIPDDFKGHIRHKSPVIIDISWGGPDPGTQYVNPRWGLSSTGKYEVKCLRGPQWSHCTQCDSENVVASHYH